MRKLGLIVAGVAAVGLYWLIGGTDDESEQQVATPTMMQPPPATPPAGRPQVSHPQHPRRWDPAPGYQAPPAYSPQISVTPGYQFRPLRKSEQGKLSQQRADGYSANVNPYAAPSVKGPDYAGIATPYNAPKPGTIQDYAALNPYAAPPQASSTYPDPYAAPHQPRSPEYPGESWPSGAAAPTTGSIYGAAPAAEAPEGYINAYPGGYPGTGGSYELRSAPGARYNFRPDKRQLEDQRWNEGRSHPPAYGPSSPQHQNHPGSRHWNRPRNQRGSFADSGPLWAARTLQL